MPAASCSTQTNLAAPGIQQGHTPTLGDKAQPRVPAVTVTGRGVSAQPGVGRGQEAAHTPGPSTHRHTAGPDATADGAWIPARAALLLWGSPKPQ